MPTLTEDDIYRSSTQFKLWAFTPEALVSMRASTNALAADGVKAAIAGLHKTPNADPEARMDYSPRDSEINVDVDCLTVEEEQKLVGFYCVKAMQLSDFCDFPTNVKVRRVSFT